jgi:tetratricopeptide (TPR) repeat protein
MGPISRLGVGAVVAAAVLVSAMPAASQQPAPALVPRQYSLTKVERAALLPFQTAVQARNTAAATAALPAARLGANGADAKYVYGTLLLQLGRDTANRQMQIEAIETILASGVADQADLPHYYGVLANLALDLAQMKKAENALVRLLEVNPNNIDALMLLGDMRSRQKRPAEALALFDRAIQLRKASGQPVSEHWYKVALKNAFDANLVPQTIKAGRDLITAYPSKENWRDVLLDYRDVARPPLDIDVDTLRLLRFTGALAGERDYELLAKTLNDNGLAGEAKAVLDEGVDSNMVDSAKAPFKDLRSSTGAKATKERKGLSAAEKSALAAAAGSDAVKVGDAYFGYGDYAKAVSLYRAALQKGGVDPNLVQTRLGLALARSGQKHEAQMAFTAINGQRADLASFLLLWLAQGA